MKNKTLKKNIFIKPNSSIILLLLAILLIIFSCKNEKSNVTIKQKVTKENIEKPSSQSNIRSKKGKIYQALINKKLIGLSIKNKKEKKIYKKYWIDFYSTCMWQAPSYYIDDKNKEFYIFNYSEKKFRGIEYEDTWVMYNIENIDFEKNNLTIKVKDTAKQDTETFMFSKLEGSEIIFKLKTKGIEVSDIIRYSIFTTEEFIGKFKKEGCGDFDG